MTSKVPSSATQAAAKPLMVPSMNMYPVPSGPGSLNIGGGLGNYVLITTKPTAESLGRRAWISLTITPKDSFFVRFTGSLNSFQSIPGLFHRLCPGLRARGS